MGFTKQPVKAKLFTALLSRHTYLLNIIILTAIYTFITVFHGISYAIDFDARDRRIDLPVLTTPNNATDPSMSSDQNNHVYAVWSDNRRGALSIYANTSFPNNGWLPRATPINTGFPKPQDSPPGDATAPRVCSDNSGHVYVAWIDDRAVKAGTGKQDIFFRYSKDYGINWYPEFIDERIDSDNPTIGDSKNLQIDCDEKGNVYIVWEDDRNKTGSFEIYFRSLQVQFNKPTDFIVYYQTPETRLNTGVDAGKYSAHFPAISTDKNGTIYAAWQDKRTKPEENIYPGIFFNSSSNHGATWKPSATHIDSAPIGGALSFSSPVISSDINGNVYIAWADNAGRATRGPDYSPDGTTDVYFNHSRDKGAVWEKDDLRIEMPNYGDHRATVKDVAIGSNNKGLVCIAWADDRYKRNNSNIFINHSQNFGQSFIDNDANIRIDNSTKEGATTASSPVIKVNDLGIVFVSWIDKRGAKDNIYFNFSADKGKKDSWQKGDFELDYPKPPGDSQSLVMTTDETGHFYVIWQDTRAALARDNYNIFFLSGFVDFQKLLIEGQRLGQSCFIATAAYGSPFERHVELLRKFRDQYLLTNITGKEFVALYYHYSPPVADYILTHSYLKPIVRIGLMPAVGVAALCLHTSFMQKVILIMVSILGLGYWARKAFIRRKKTTSR